MLHAGSDNRHKLSQQPENLAITAEACTQLATLICTKTVSNTAVATL